MFLCDNSPPYLKQIYDKYKEQSVVFMKSKTVAVNTQVPAEIGNNLHKSHNKQYLSGTVNFKYCN